MEYQVAAVVGFINAVQGNRVEAGFGGPGFNPVINAITPLLFG
ncbi:MAG: hypothetical protein VB084_03790 [Syntrophomonadaceae bacterium]|nr:hypothetical protein [Syntrophomonadaceae bacterium]